MKLVFAGTRLGREVVGKLLQQGEEVIVSTATKYGGELYKKHEKLIINSKKLNLDEMTKLVLNYPIDEIIDATHPYAVNVSDNIKECSKMLDIPYKSVERDSYMAENDCKDIIILDTYQKASEYILENKGNTLLTIGSNNLHLFSRNDKSRIWIRVLPTSQVLEKCEKLGFNPKNIIAIQGPFSYNINKAFYMEYDIDFIITKDSGKSGGTEEKIASALDMGIQVIMINRP